MFGIELNSNTIGLCFLLGIIGYLLLGAFSKSRQDRALKKFLMEELEKHDSVVSVKTLTKNVERDFSFDGIDATDVCGALIELFEEGRIFMDQNNPLAKKFEVPGQEISMEDIMRLDFGVVV